MGRSVSCLVNLRACHETELIIYEDMIPESDQLNIGVIGSGLAGLSLATTSARMGQCVTLYNRDEDIRGHFSIARLIPGKEEFNETIRYFCNELNKLEIGGELRFEIRTDITYSDMERLISSSYSSTSGGGEGEDSEGGDWWIMETGVEPIIPPIPGLNNTRRKRRQ